MSSVSGITNLAFNGPFKRAELLLLPQYAASSIFIDSGVWTGSKNHVLSCNGGKDGDVTEPLYCIVVGTISDDKIYVEKHGNFSSKFGIDARKAKIQFTLTRPNDPDFGPDYDKAVAAFEHHQSTISIYPRQLFFLLKDQASSMRMNYALFEPKGDSNDEARDRETQSYIVASEHDEYWTGAKSTSYCCIMPVFDTNDTPVNPNRFADKLVGALCEVTFTLRHYAIGGKDPNDVFSAHVESVAILKQPPIVVPSPYKGRLTRRPHHKPQLPTRGEQVGASLAFVPLPVHNSTPALSDTSLPLVVGCMKPAVPSGVVPADATPAVDITRLAKNDESAANPSPDMTFAIPAIQLPASATTGKTYIVTDVSPSSTATLASDDGKDSGRVIKKRKVGK